MFSILSNIESFIQVIIEGIILFFIIAWLEKRKRGGN